MTAPFVSRLPKGVIVLLMNRRFLVFSNSRQPCIDVREPPYNFIEDVLIIDTAEPIRRTRRGVAAGHAAALLPAALAFDLVGGRAVLGHAPSITTTDFPILRLTLRIWPRASYRSRFTAVRCQVQIIRENYPSR